jgi:hypothetical protein
MTATFADFKDLLVQTNPSTCPFHLQMQTWFGKPGSGKTTVAANIPEHLYIDLEASATEHSINKLDIKTWAKFKDFLEYVQANPGCPFDGKTLIIDTVTELWELCVKHELAARKLAAMPDDFGRTLVQIRNEFKRVMGILLQLRMAQRMGCVLIAHENVREEKTALAATTIYEPRVNDKDVAGWIAEKAQMVLRFSREDIDPVKGKPFTDGTKWIIRTKPLSASDVVKDRTLRLPKYVLATYDDLAVAYDNGDGA